MIQECRKEVLIIIIISIIIIITRPELATSAFIQLEFKKKIIEGHEA